MKQTIDPQSHYVVNSIPSGVDGTDPSGGLMEVVSGGLPLATSTSREALPAMSLDFGLRARAARVLLLGGAGGVARRLEADLIGVDPERTYVPFRARAASGFMLDELASDLQLHRSATRRMPVAEHEGDLIGLLPETPNPVHSGIVGIGPDAQIDKLVDSFQLASRAVDAAVAFGLIGVHEFADLGVLPTIVTDTDVGDTLRCRYLEPLFRIDEGNEIVAVIESFFANGMHVDATAAKLSLHPNTLRNKIARFEDIAGVDMRNTGEAMQVWWALRFVAVTDAQAKGRSE